MLGQNNNTDTKTVKDTNTQQTQVQQTQVQQTQVQQTQQTAQVQNNSQRLLTQDQVNDIVAERVNGMTAKYNALNTQYEQLSNNLTAAIDELQTYKNKELATKAGVQSQFVDFVLYEAKKNVTDKKGIDSAIADFVKANPYVANNVTAENNTNNKGTKTGFNSQNNVDTSVDAEVEAFLKAKGYKK